MVTMGLWRQAPSSGFFALLMAASRHGTAAAAGSAAVLSGFPVSDHSPCDEEDDDCEDSRDDQCRYDIGLTIHFIYPFGLKGPAPAHMQAVFIYLDG